MHKLPSSNYKNEDDSFNGLARKKEKPNTETQSEQTFYK